MTSAIKSSANITCKQYRYWRICGRYVRNKHQSKKKINIRTKVSKICFSSFVLQRIKVKNSKYITFNNTKVLIRKNLITYQQPSNGLKWKYQLNCPLKMEDTFLFITTPKESEVQENSYFQGQGSWFGNVLIKESFINY